MEGEGIRRDWTTVSDGRRQGSGIGDRRRSGEWRTPWRDYTGYICWYGDGGRPDGKMIPCGGATGSVVRQGRMQTIPKREF